MGDDEEDEDEEEEGDVDEPGFVTMRAWEGDLDKEFPAETPEGQVAHLRILLLFTHSHTPSRTPHTPSHTLSHLTLVFLYLLSHNSQESIFFAN